ncbi:MAG: glycosyltransferase [Sphingobacteriaceae bacterium]|nr:MAG: glycosyltransferase [Sphingobacteriaceae bacterium]
MPKLSIVIPCYFNEKNIPVTIQRLIENEINFPTEVSFEYVFVNDGSGDDTLGALHLAQQQYPAGGFDFVFFDKQVASEVIKMHERNSNVFYLMIWLGFTYINIPYVRKKREIGKSRWTISKKVKLFIDSLLSFSFVPVRIISALGLGLGLIAVIYGIYIICLKLISSNEPEGWTALMVVLLFVSAFQMVALGIIGEYVWRGLDAARQRPLYVVRHIFNTK